MWNHYKRTFLVVQMAAGWVSYMVYRDTHHAWLPTAIFFVTAQISAVFGAMWTHRLRMNMQAHPSRVINQ
jgi:hypothetical protein